MVFSKHLNKYYKKYWYLFLIGIISLMICDLFHLAEPVCLGLAVKIFQSGDLSSTAPITVSFFNWDITFEMEHKRLMLWVINVIVGSGIILFLGRVGFRFTLFTASTKIESDFRQEMFEKSERLSLSYYQNNKVGTILAWFSTDLEAISDFIGWGTVMLVDAFFLSLATIIVMFGFDWLMTCIILIPVILIIAWGALVEKYMGKIWEVRQKAFDKLYDFAQENFTGIRVIKAFVKENREIHRFAKVAKENSDTNIKFARMSVLFDVFIEVIIGLIIVIMLAIGGWFVWATITGNPIQVFGYKEQIDGGILLTFVGYFDVLVWPLIAMGQIFTMRSRCKTSLKRVSEFLDTEEDIQNPDGAIVLRNVKGNLTFKNLTFRYPGAKQDSLKNVSLEIHSGEIIGVVGKIGSGKSTFVNMLVRLYNIDKGCVFIDDVDLMEADINSVRNAISIVPQDNFLFSDSIKNNVAFCDTKLTNDQVSGATMFASVHDDITGFEKGYETVCGERGVTLSGGQKQRISIARAYLRNTPILILDDSVSAVDTRTEEKIIKHLKEHRENKTTIVVASRISTVQSFDKIIVFNDGKVEGFDTHDKLLRTSSTYAKMVYLQTLEEEIKGGN